jgi:uncharacterized protein (DUF305 family)
MNLPATTLRRRPHLLAVIPFAVMLALVAGCGNGDDSAPLSSTKHNKADVSFATEMIQHHAQALAMVELTVGRPMSSEFQTLASRIREAQAPEIERMTDWLEEWDEEVPQTMNDHMNHDMGTMPEDSADMPGMMSADELKELEEASDTEFQKMWLEMMIRHHEGAIAMARTQKKDGRYEPAVELAESVISSQDAEIEEMKGLIATS